MGSLHCEAPPRGAGGWDPQGHPSTGRLRPAQLAGLAFGQLASRLHFDAPLSFRGRVRCTVPRSAGDRMCFRTRIGLASFTRCPSCVLSVLAFLRSRVRCKPRLPPQRPACARGTPHLCRRPWHTPRRRPAWPTCPPLLIAMATSLRVRLGSFPRPPARASVGGEGACARPAAASALLRAPALARGLWPVARPPPPPAEVLLRDCFSAGNAPGESCSPGSPCWGSAPAPGRVQKPRGADGSAGSFPAWGSMWVSAGLSLGRPRCRPGALTAPLAPQLPAARALPHSRPKAQGLLAAGQEPSSTARAEGLQPGVQKPNKNNPAGKILET